MNEQNLNLYSLLGLLNESPTYRTLVSTLEEGPTGRPETCDRLGVPLAARPTVLAALHAHMQRPIVVVVARADRARALAHQVRLWSPYPRAVLRLPDPDSLPYERVAWGRETISERVRVLSALADWQGGLAQRAQRAQRVARAQRVTRVPPMVIVSARGIMQKTAPPDILAGKLHHLHVGQRLALEDVLDSWVAMGYRPSSMVEEPGTFSRRGGILDVFPPQLAYPLRIELFGDEIESLRTFDPVTQRSERRVTEFDVVPAHEAMLHLSPAAAESARELDLTPCHAVARSNFEQDLDHLRNSEYFRGVEFYLPLFYNPPASPLEYLPDDGLLMVEEPAELIDVLDELDAQADNLKQDLLEQGELPAGWPHPYFQPQELIAGMAGRPHLVIGRTSWDGSRSTESPNEVQEVYLDQGEPEDGCLSELFGPAPVFGGQLKRLVDDVAYRRAGGERVVLVSRQAARLADLLAERDIAFLWGEPLQPTYELAETEPWQETSTQEDAPPGASITLFQGSLAEGCVLRQQPAPGDVGTAWLTRAAGCAVLTDSEIFGYHKPEPRRRPTARRSVTPESFFADLHEGDYVVHAEHGIGVFRGLVKLELGGTENEYLQVDYAAEDRLYVPIHQADFLSRYVGVDDRPPAVNRLGAADWAIARRRARRAVEDIAAELLEIYAAREIARGHAFSPDATWQHELEAAFPYVETDDQLHAIQEVKDDMEHIRPMDRLICGDVGYGKTEVALRATFKAVLDGMQVAVLVPTTVLAQQHYHTFVERLKPYPVVVEMLSRFRSRKEQQKILDDMARGGVDIVIGTHRLLQKDVRFKSLGLLIIDEEQRFGVSHKERLKQLRTEMDVLTLTATPIPRTLHMALTGVRDMSTIDTPPAERLSIKTSVVEYDETVIRNAILREIGRGGQVYFVHNRVMGIEQVARRLAGLVPEASVAVAHGQMPEGHLERVMVDFMDGKHDVLVCTSIIESGLDIPNVNTIIINQAHQFGLAQLYQLRGRVGRAAVRAYAYLLVPRHLQLSDVARRRLEAITEASDLGAGFRIAMRDLEIRGAGDLLGQRQHGHIAAVGFDLYTRLLAQAVRRLTDDRRDGSAPATGMLERKDAADYLAPLIEGVQINLPLAVYLPENYVPDANLRLQLYRRLAGLTSEEEVAAMGQELKDRFGELPEPVINLLYQLRLKTLAIEAGVQAISTEAGQVLIKADGMENINREALQSYVGPQTRVSRRQIWMPLHPHPAVWQTELERILRHLHRMIHDPGR